VSGTFRPPVPIDRRLCGTQILSGRGGDEEKYLHLPIICLLSMGIMGSFLGSKAARA